MKKLLFWPYQIYALFLFLPLVVLSTLVFSTIAVVVGTLVSPKAGSRYGGRGYAKSIGYLTPIGVSVEGDERIDPAESYVVVCNHVSQYDIVAVYGWLNLDLKWVIKQEIRKIPGIGIGCEKVGHIFVDRKNPAKARRAIRHALDRLGDGVGILFFPEGTRSDDGRLMAFKKGAFRTAVDLELPVLPVTVLGTQEILPARTLKLFPGKATLIIHEPIPTQGKTLSDIDSVMSQARAAINSGLPPWQRDPALLSSQGNDTECT